MDDVANVRRAPEKSDSFDWVTPFENCEAVASGNDDSLEPLNLQSLQGVDSASWLARTSTFEKGIDERERKQSLEERFMDYQPPMKNQKRKNREGECEDTPLPTASSKRKKKPNGMPKRPLSAYNCYFQEERMRLIKRGQVLDGPNILPSGKIPFEELAKLIGNEWKSLPESEKKRFHDMSAQDNIRYHKQMEEWKRNNADGHDLQKKSSEVSSYPFSSMSEIDLTKERKQDNSDFPSFSAPETSILDSANFPSQGSFGLGFSPFPSPQPSVEGSDTMNAQEVAGDTFNSSSASNASLWGMGAGNERVYRAQSSYAGRVYEPTAFPGGQPTLFPTDQAPFHQQQMQMQFQRQYNTQSQFGGIPFQGLGGPPGVMLSGWPSRVHDPSPDAIPVSPDMEITFPDSNGVQQKYKVQYACYLVTRDEAKDYVEKFGDCPLRVGPPPCLPSGARHLSGNIFGPGV
eukprot:CAMPEP_0202487360 /NCGR_PEP_ID=MMETSP1361-20130828/5687_1 /ASSEMBLY_ACC=CAM_ASM_000849 /TAXON_ID=210615 /ORGANISM="Staurosira complex sp., Strain CCMP2646" /LENGTH=459 /DNA_ID=CAMNT_0049116713 /DNA_START=65 /DNA_END=1444 /DNA_ORIENTATION=+